MLEIIVVLFLSHGATNSSSSIALVSLVSLVDIMSRNTYNLTHNGTFMKLKEEQLTKKWIGRIFQVFPDSVVLISEDGEVETPDPSTGRFKLHRYADYNVIANSLSTCTMSQAVGSPSTSDDSAKSGLTTI
uniref:Uncharacterized protein n=1 Tax=Amphimedon queenslandica TaxID=400682 RepID=A0A1X7T8I2_AMPQE